MRGTKWRGNLVDYQGIVRLLRFARNDNMGVFQRYPLMLKGITYIFHDLLNDMSFNKSCCIYLDMARAYLTYLQKPYLIGEVRSYARSLKAQQVAPRKIYAGDLGLRHVAALTFDEDIGRLEETAVFHGLEMRKQDLFYFAQQSGGVDFLVCRGLKAQEMIQVTHFDLSEEKIRARDTWPPDRDRPLSWFRAHAYHRRLAGCRNSTANKKSATMGMAS